MLDDANKKRIDTVNKGLFESAEFNANMAHSERRAQHAKVVNAGIRLGLQRFENAFARKRARRTIPPGWYDICSTGLKAALRTAGEIATRRAALGHGRRVDPNNTGSAAGTANIGMGHGRSLVATDATPYGHWRAFLMDLFSSGCKISGADVKLMLEIWNHAFEPFQEVSFFYLMRVRDSQTTPDRDTVLLPFVCCAGAVDRALVKVCVPSACRRCSATAGSKARASRRRR